MHGYIRERKEIPNDVKHLTFQFCYTKTDKCYFMIGGQHWWDDYLCIFFIFQFFLYQKQNKKKTENKQKHVKQSKA